MHSNIHPTAIVEDGANLADDVQVGAFCHIGPQVTLGEGSMLETHVVLAGNTKIGARAHIYPFSSIGHDPQDLKFHGEENALIIGDDCLIREGVTMNPGTEGGTSDTTIGNACKFLAYSHVAHDCHIGNNVLFSNSVMIAGHCIVEDNVIIGGGSGVHQFCRIGKNAFIGGLAGLEADLIPYGMALGNRAYLGGLNIIGMKRAGIKRESIHKARALFKTLFSSDAAVKDLINDISPEFEEDAVCKEIIDFIRASADRSLCTPR